MPQKSCESSSQEGTETQDNIQLRDRLQLFDIRKSTELSLEIQIHIDPLISHVCTWLSCSWELIHVDDQQSKMKHGNRYLPSTPHHSFFSLFFLKLHKQSKWAFFNISRQIFVSCGANARRSYPSNPSAPLPLLVVLWRPLWASWWPCAHVSWATCRAVELPQIICSLDIEFTVLHFTCWFNELLVTRLMFTVTHQGTILFQSWGQIIAVKVHDYDCVIPIFYTLL